MAYKFKKIEIPDLVGKRIRHRQPGLGQGTIVRAWLSDPDTVCVTIDFDDSTIKNLLLMDCYKSRILIFDDSSITHEKILELISRYQNPVLPPINPGKDPPKEPSLRQGTIFLVPMS